MLVLVGQVRPGNEARLQQARDERAGAGEGVEDVDVVVAERGAELVAQHVLYARDDEVHDFHRRVDDPEAPGEFRKRIIEELVVELLDDFLPARRALDPFGAQLHAGIELLQRVGFLVEVVLMQGVEHLLHGPRHRVVAGKAVLLEQRLEHWPRDEMLRQHLDDLGIGDGVVQVIAQFLREGGESLALGRVGRVFEDGGDAVDVRVRDPRDVRRPFLPVVAVADLLHEFRVDGLFDLADLELERMLLGRLVGDGLTDRLAAARAGSVLRLVRGAQLRRFLLHLVGDRDDFHPGGVLAVELQLVDHRVELVVMAAQRLQDLPHHLVGDVVVQRLVRLLAGGNHHRKDDVAALFAGRLAHHPADGLHHIHL